MLLSAAWSLIECTQRMKISCSAGFIQLLNSNQACGRIGVTGPIPGLQKSIPGKQVLKYHQNEVLLKLTHCWKQYIKSN